MPPQIFPGVKPVKACAFQRFKTIDSWAHLIGYLVIYMHCFGCDEKHVL